MTKITDATGLSLVADIGGTNTRVALARGAVVERATVTRYANAEHADLVGVVTISGQRGSGRSASRRSVSPRGRSGPGWPY